MPNHLQSRTDDMHPEKDKSALRPSTFVIGLLIIGAVVAILLLS